MSYRDALIELENRIGDFCIDVTGLPVSFRNESQQKLTEQHVQIYFDRIEEVGWEHSGTLDIDNKQKSYKEYEVFIEILCSRGDYTQAVLGDIRHQVSTSSGLYYKYFGDNKYGYLRSTNAQKRFVPVDGIQYEERSIMTLVFSMMVESVDIEDVGTIETVEIINIKSKLSEDQILTDDNITITYP